MTPEGFFEALFASGDCHKVGPREIRGVGAVGFEVSDIGERFLGEMGLSQKLVNFFFSVKSSSTCMWVNPKTRLSIQVECEGEIGPCLVTGYRKVKLHEIDDRWESNVDLDEDLFHPEIPEDYQHLGMPSALKAGAALYSISVAGGIPIAFILTRRSLGRPKK